MKRLARLVVAAVGLGALTVQLLVNPMTAYAAGETAVVAAAANSIYLAPATGNYPVNGAFAVDLRETSNGTSVNAVLATVTYSDNIQFDSVSGDTSAFDVDAQRSGGSGVITIARGSTKPLSGDQEVAKLNFKVTASGTGTLTVDGTRSKLLASAGNQNIATVFGTGSYVLVPATSAAANAPVPSAYPIPAPSTGAPNVSITPQGSNPTPTILPDDSEINVSKPATIQTTPSADKTVSKVQYYIDGKLVMTVNEPPYSYSVDTSNMRNGRYKLTTKTTYTDGSSDSVDSVLNVSNPLTGKQLGLQLGHYAWLIILLALAAGVFIYFRFFRLRNSFGDGYMDPDAYEMGLNSVPQQPMSNDPLQFPGNEQQLPQPPQQPQDQVPPQDPNDPNRPPNQYGPY